MRIIFYPYKMKSKSAKLLARRFQTVRVLPFGRYRSRYHDVVVNWGNSTIPFWGAKVLNKPEAVAISINKLKTFQKLQLKEVPTPEWTTSYETANQWLQEGHKVYARTVLSGHSGNGIVVCSINSGSPLVNAPLYTKRVKAKHEYRVHVFNGSIIDQQQKKRRNGVETTGLIRNHMNGYVFARQDVVLPEIVKSTAIAAVAALRLDFGAVDIGYVERDDKAFVYEINSAPGIEGTTIDRYEQAILNSQEYV